MSVKRLKHFAKLSGNEDRFFEFLDTIVSSMEKYRTESTIDVYFDKNYQIEKIKKDYRYQACIKVNNLIDLAILYRVEDFLRSQGFDTSPQPHFIEGDGPNLFWARTVSWRDDE